MFKNLFSKISCLLLSEWTFLKSYSKAKSFHLSPTVASNRLKNTYLGPLVCQTQMCHQLLVGSNHPWTAFLSHLPYFWPLSPVLELRVSVEVCHQEPTLGLLCQSLSLCRTVQVSGPQGSVGDRAMRAPAVPTGLKAGERGQKYSSAPPPLISKWIHFRVSQGILHFLAW